jgi:predicted esterase
MSTSRLASAAAMLVLCAFSAQAHADPPPGELVETMHCRTDASQTYTLYLPSDYTPQKRWPALIVMDPRGRSKAAAERFRPAAEEFGWILLSSDNTISDGPVQPNIKAINALWPETHLRYSIDPQRIYLAGFSGTAMFAWDFARQIPAIAGILAASGRFARRERTPVVHTPTFGTSGWLDFNHLEMELVHEMLDKWDVPNRLEFYPGPHSWMPPQLAREGVAWMELLAMKKGARPRDESEIEKLWQEDLSSARAMEANGDLPAAQRRYAAIAETFDGLHDIDAVRRKASALARTREVEAYDKEEERAARFERRALSRSRSLQSHLLADPPPTPARLEAELGIDGLQKIAKEDGPMANAAGRVLESFGTLTGFYLPRALMRKEDYTRAAASLTIAVKIHPERAFFLYNLACSEAHIGRKDKAFEHLQRAIAAGYNHREAIENDPDLKSLHDDPRFAELLKNTK